MSDEPFVILGREVGKGESEVIEVEVAKLHTRNRLTMPVIVERADREGPTLLLMGGVHGDEINGVAIVREIIRQGYNKPLRGTIICIPVFNVFGYLNHQREFPDGRDLNRVFPGTPKGSLASQFAYKFTKDIAPLADYVLDFHTGGAERTNYPNIRCVLRQPELLDLARVFGAPFIVNSGYIPKSIRKTLDKMGKQVLVYEGGKSFELNPFVVEHGVAGALNVMRHLGMQDGEIDGTADPIVVKRGKWLRAPHAGLFQPLVENGSHIDRKAVIGRISDPYGDFEQKIVAPLDGYVFGVNTAPIVNKGDALFHVSVETA